MLCLREVLINPAPDFPFLPHNLHYVEKAPPDFFRICLYEEREAGQLYRRLKGIGSFLTAQGEKDNMTAVLIGYEKEESVWKKNEKSVKNTF